MTTGEKGWAVKTQNDKERFDQLLFGATSFVERILARYLFDQFGTGGDGFRWAAACMAQDLNATERKGGFWTPATLLGDRLVERLIRYAGLRFEIFD